MAGESLTEATGAESGEVSEAQIAVHWREEGYYFPSAKFIGQANTFDPDIFERSQRTGSPIASRSTATCSAGTRTGTRRSTQRTRRFGSGSWVAA